ncbi:hypothetical protein D3C79_1038180 [compost metagenome]
MEQDCRSVDQNEFTQVNQQHFKSQLHFQVINVFSLTLLVQSLGHSAGQRFGKSHLYCFFSFHLILVTSLVLNIKHFSERFTVRAQDMT